MATYEPLPSASDPTTEAEEKLLRRMSYADDAAAADVKHNIWRWWLGWAGWVVALLLSLMLMWRFWTEISQASAASLEQLQAVEEKLKAAVTTQEEAEEQVQVEMSVQEGAKARVDWSGVDTLFIL